MNAAAVLLAATATAAVNLVLAACNYRLAKRNAANARANREVIGVLKGGDLDGAEIVRAIEKHQRVRGRSGGGLGLS